jgi:multimeric flavodoxin WrbA
MILMLNCSYKAKDGNTQYFLENLKNEFGEREAEIISLRQVLNGGFEAFTDKLQQAEAFVIGAPLYVDGLPAQAVKLLEMLSEADRSRFVGKKVYAVSNLGFYEGEQICNLFDIVRNWCVHMQMVYGGGLAVGAGPMVKGIKSVPFAKQINRDIEKGVKLLADRILTGEAMENYYAKTRIPRMVYMQAAHMLFRRALKKNGK